MYTVTNNGVLKTVETWSVMVPLHDNDGQPFDKASIDSILEDILLDYPGFTVANSVGYWKGADRVHIDQNHEVVIDAVPDDVCDSSKFFADLKNELKERLKQDKVYVTRQASKEELLSFSEFFDEIGVLSPRDDEKEEAKQIAQQLTKQLSFVLERLGYETTTLRRDRERSKIIWERKLCGIRLKSELVDTLPAEVKLIAADQVSELSDVIAGESPFAIIGGYEYQAFILEKQARHSLADIRKHVLDIRTGYSLVTGEAVPAGRIIEDFVAAVLTNCVALRDEGFLPKDIRINVGKDGSLQIASNGKTTVLLHSPAILPNKIIQKEILRCLRQVLERHEANDLDPIAVMQAKATHSYIIVRALIRRALRDANDA